MKIEMHKNDISCKIEITAEEVIQLEQSGVLMTLFNIAVHPTSPSEEENNADEINVINELYNTLIENIKPYVANLNSEEREEVIQRAYSYCYQNRMSKEETEWFIERLKKFFREVPYKGDDEKNDMPNC